MTLQPALDERDASSSSRGRKALLASTTHSETISAQFNNSSDDKSATDQDLEGAVQLRSLFRSPGISDEAESLYEGEVDDVGELADEDSEMLRHQKKNRTKERRDSFTLYTPDEERTVLRKLDKRLVLFVALLYMLSFLDRSNIGNARIAGMTEDLYLSSSQYEWLLTAFYMTYILFEWMALLYQILPAHVYISVCVLSWGLIASVQSVAISFAWMFILRGLLGVAEAAFSPGLPFYLSFFFKREELALRTGLVISAAPLATSFASSLAWAITKIGKRSSIAPWRLLYLIEGFPSLIAAAVAWYQIPDTPSTARFLTERQKQIAKLRLRHERTAGASPKSGGPRGLRWKEIGRTLIDPKCYLTAMMFFSSNVAFSSLPPFLPTIINEMEYSSLASQALSAPPYLISFVLVLVVARLSDYHQSRAVFLILSALVGASGYSLLAVAGALQLPSAVRYAAVFPAAAGFFCAVTLIITWTINNQASDEGKGTGVAMLNVIGQMGPLVGTRLYPDTDKPYYVRGMAVCAGFMVAVAGLAWVLMIVLKRANTKRLEEWNGESGLEMEYMKVAGGEGDEEGDGAERVGNGSGGKGSEKPFVYIL